MALPPNRVDYSPIIDRPKLEWPNGERVALWIAPNVEHYEYLPVWYVSTHPPSHTQGCGPAPGRCLIHKLAVGVYSS